MCKCSCVFVINVSVNLYVCLLVDIFECIVGMRTHEHIHVNVHVNVCVHEII